MTHQDYFSYLPETSQDERRRTWPTRPPLPPRKTSMAHNAAMRDIIRPWAEIPNTPPSCRTVSYSSWSRFSASGTSTPNGELKASRLCTPHGASPSYSPPAGEWTYLGAEQPLHCGKPVVQRSRHRRQQSAQSSGTCPSLSSTASSRTEATEPIDFQRQHIKRVSTSSLLTQSFTASYPRASPGKGAGETTPTGMQGLAARLGLDTLNCEDLPSAFDSDDEDEDEFEMEGVMHNTGKAGPRDGNAHRAEGHKVVR